MKTTLTALSLALALTGASAFAQQQQQSPRSETSGNASSSSGPTFTEKVKQAAQNIGEKTKEAAQKMKEKAQQTADKSKTSDNADKATKSNGASGTSTAAVQMQRKADADLRSAKAKCASMEDSSQKAVCQKQATAAHANAEVRIEKARAANDGTATMGAGKSSR